MKLIIPIITIILLIRLYFVIKRIGNNRIVKGLTDKLSLIERITWLFFGFNTLAILTLLILLFL